MTPLTVTVLEGYNLFIRKRKERLDCIERKPFATPKFTNCSMEILLRLFKENKERKKNVTLSREFIINYLYFNYPNICWKLISIAVEGRTCVNGLKLQRSRFSLSIKKNFLVLRYIKQYKTFAL